MDSIVDWKLRTACELGLDPRKVSPEGTWFAWRPVRLTTGGWRWLRRVEWFRPLGLFTEYFDPRPRMAQPPETPVFDELCASGEIPIPPPSEPHYHRLWLDAVMRHRTRHHEG